MTIDTPSAPPTAQNDAPPPPANEAAPPTPPSPPQAPESQKPQEAPPAPAVSAVEAAQAEFAEKGELSDESFAKLEKAGYSRKHVEAYIEGQRALAAADETKIYSAVGGKEGYAELTKWAAENLAPEQIEAYNKSVSQGNATSLGFAVASLAAMRRAADPMAGSTRYRGAAAPAAQPAFEDRASMVEAMKDPRYETSEAYRKEVFNRVARSGF